MAKAVTSAEVLRTIATAVHAVATIVHEIEMTSLVPNKGRLKVVEKTLTSIGKVVDILTPESTEPAPAENVSTDADK